MGQSLHFSSPNQPSNLRFAFHAQDSAFDLKIRAESKNSQNSFQKTTQELQKIAHSGAVNAISFPYYLYDFMKSLGLEIDFLTWNEGQNYFENSLNPAFSDSQIKVILAGEKGKYR